MVSKIAGFLLFSYAVSIVGHYEEQWIAILKDQPDTAYEYLCGIDTTEMDSFLDHILQNLTSSEVFQVCSLILATESSRNGSPRSRSIAYAKEQLIFRLQTTNQGMSFLKRIITLHPQLADLISLLAIT